MYGDALLDVLGHGTGVSHQWFLAREREIQKNGGVMTSLIHKGS